nr:beta-ketoacyl synthase N-terminal-like domain-containing protein [Streptomyces longispororuber]
MFRLDRFARPALVAAHEAVRSAGPHPAAGDGARVGVVLGTGPGGAAGGRSRPGACVLAGGTEAPLTPITVADFHHLGVLSRCGDDPAPLRRGPGRLRHRRGGRRPGRVGLHHRRPPPHGTAPRGRGRQASGRLSEAPPRPGRRGRGPGAAGATPAGAAGRCGYGWSS